MTVHQELREVPADLTARQGRFQIIIQRVFVRPVHVDLVKERKGHAVIERAETLDGLGRRPVPAPRIGCKESPK